MAVINMKVELDLPNYTSKFAKKADLANLKSDVDRLDINNLETTPLNLSKLSNVVKKTLYMTN